MALLDPHFNFDISNAEEIGKAIISLKELTGKTASGCADLIFSQNPEAKSLLFGGNSNGIAKGVITSSQ